MIFQCTLGLNVETVTYVFLIFLFNLLEAFPSSLDSFAAFRLSMCFGNTDANIEFPVATNVKTKNAKYSFKGKPVPSLPLAFLTLFIDHEYMEPINDGAIVLKVNGTVQSLYLLYREKKAVQF